jgi:hypothetical protein
MLTRAHIIADKFVVKKSILSFSARVDGSPEKGGDD